MIIAVWLVYSAATGATSVHSTLNFVRDRKAKSPLKYAKSGSAISPSGIFPNRGPRTASRRRARHPLADYRCQISHDRQANTLLGFRSHLGLHCSKNKLFGASREQCEL